MATLKDLINSTAKLATSEANFCLKRSDALQTDVVKKIDEYCSADSKTALKKKAVNLAHKYDKAREYILENKEVFLDSMAITGFMGKESAGFIKDSCLNLTLANGKITEKLDKEYLKLFDEFNKNKLKGRKTTATKPRRKTVHRPSRK